MSLTATGRPPGASGSAPTPRPPGPAATVPRRLGRVVRLRTRPARIRALAVACLLAVAVVFVVTVIAIANARDGLRVIGRGAGPQVVATANLYFALSDMDAQVANVLLIGRDHNLGVGRERALDRYEQRRSDVDQAILQAAVLARDDASGRQTVQSVLDGLGRYERLVSRAMLLDDQANHPAGPPPAQVVDLYRQATDLMRHDLLPKANNLTLDNATIVRHTYEEKRSAVLAGRWWVVLVVLVLLAALVGLQLYLARRFRRAVNPFLAIVTVGAGVLAVTSLLLLSQEAEHLRAAKQDGFDSILAFSRARAISNGVHADESRYLLDPGRADTYEQVYLDRSQAILYVDAGNLDAYYRGVDADASSYPARASFLGFLGDAARNATSPREEQALKVTLDRYRSFQLDDQRVRQLATAGQRREALAVHLGLGPGASSYDFDQFDAALSAHIDHHREVFDTAVHAGDRDLSGWSVILPLATVGMALLVLVGVQPRLAEYR